MEAFRKIDGTIITEVGNYVVDFLIKYPNSEVMIGCDSQNARDKTKYVTAICLYTPGQGIHVIYKDEKVNRVKELFNRLWGEVERSKIIADELIPFIHENYSEAANIAIHFDANPKKEHGSNVVYDAGMGYITGSGYIAVGKPFAIAASRCADRLCKPKRSKRVHNKKNKKK
jgi:predicted RNase H-related nuclease YkuK (DUF458 family)